MTTTETYPHAHVIIDARRFDVVVISLDAHGRVHVAAHVRDSYAQLVASTDGSETTANKLLDAKGVSRRRTEVYVGNAHDVEIVMPPYGAHESAAPMLEKLRIAAGL